MKNFIFFILLIVSVSCKEKTRSYTSAIFKADSLYTAGNYSGSLQAYEEAFLSEKKDRLHLYNAGCSAALAGEEGKAFAFLNAAIDNGWTNIQRLNTDRDLISLHQDQSWNDLVNKARRKQEELKIIYAPVQAELLQILEDDQRPKKAFHATSDPEKRDSIREAGLILDSLNLVKVKSVLDK